MRKKAIKAEASDDHVNERIDLYDWLGTDRPQRHLGDHDAPLRVVDDWPNRVPVTVDEVDVFERWFGDIIDELFANKP